MATLSLPNHSHAHRNNLAQRFPMRLEELHQIHHVNYGLLLSSLVITVALMAVAYMIAVTMSQRAAHQANPMHDIAQGASYGATATHVTVN